MWIGISTAYTILGERIAPKLADFYLARTGVSGQQIDKELPRLGSNVDAPRDDDEDQGAHGPFDDKAHATDPVSWLSMHRRAALGAMGATGVTRLLVRRYRG
jgi:hypothetical protein